MYASEYWPDIFTIKINLKAKSVSESNLESKIFNMNYNYISVNIVITKFVISQYWYYYCYNQIHSKKFLLQNITA